jgi:N-methylhydantoinase A
MGLLVSDLKRDTVETRFAELDAVDVNEIQRRFHEMEQAAHEEFASQGIPPERIVHERAIDLRYSIQKYELPVPVARGQLRADDKAGWRRAFDEVHEKHFGSRAEDQKVEVVNYRLTTKVLVPKPAVAELPMRPEISAEAVKAHRKAYFDGWCDCAIYDRERLVSGNRLRGPAIIEQMDSTTVVQPGQEAHIDGFGNVIIEIGGDKR